MQIGHIPLSQALRLPLLPRLQLQPLPPLAPTLPTVVAEVVRLKLLLGSPTGAFLRLLWSHSSMAAVAATGTIWRSNNSTGPVEGDGDVDGDVLGAPSAPRRRLSHQPEIGGAIAQEQEAKRLLMTLSLPL